MFCFRKKKKNTAKILAIIGIFIAAAAAAVGAYFLFTKVLKGKLFAKKACEEPEECIDVEEMPEELCEEVAETVEATEVAEEAVEVEEAVEADETIEIVEE